MKAFIIEEKEFTALSTKYLFEVRNGLLEDIRDSSKVDDIMEVVSHHFSEFTKALVLD